MLYRAAPLPIDISLQAAVRQSSFFGGKAFGVVPFARGFGIRVKTSDCQEILLQIHSENSINFMGKRWDISSLAFAMGKESVQDFISGWAVRPLHTVRQGFRKT